MKGLIYMDDTITIHTTIILLLNATIQVIILSLIPFVWWIITSRKKDNFLVWLGIKTPIIANTKSFFFCLSGILLTFVLFSVITPLSIDLEYLANAQFQTLNFFGIVNILIYAFIQTSLSEEIFFRGFLLKRISNKFSFQIGNFVQALLFGLLHGAIFSISTALELFALVTIVAVTSFIGWALGYINEKQSDSSIIPSWILHGVANTMSTLILQLAFVN